MRRIIDGRMYNTETAVEICGISHSHYTDFHHYEETLYKTPKGAFFLVGEGGPLSKYARSLGNNSRGGGDRGARARR